MRQQHTHCQTRGRLSELHLRVQNEPGGRIQRTRPRDEVHLPEFPGKLAYGRTSAVHPLEHVHLGRLVSRLSHQEADLPGVMKFVCDQMPENALNVDA